MTKWTAPDIASIRGDNSRPLQKIFGSLSEHLKDYQNGYTLDSLDDVVITSPTAGQTLSYDALTSLWKNTSLSGSLSGNASTATNLSTDRTNWSTNGTISAVVGQLAWKNFGNSHTIFDASESTSPNGSAVNNTNSQVPWTGTYPTLMGWNGTFTYGVRVDSARTADIANSVGTLTSLTIDGPSSTSFTLGDTGFAGYSGVQGDKGYLLVGNSVGDPAIYLRNSGAGSVNLGASNSNTLQVGNGTVTVAGTMNATSFVGPLTGNVTGNVSGSAATVTGASQTAITALGSLTSLLVGKVCSHPTVAGANDTGSFSVRGNASFPAVMSFHRTGAYAVNFGLSTNNVMELGGWSATTIKFSVNMINGNVTAVGGLNAYSITGNSNVAGTGNASYHPSGIYSTGTNWLYGTLITNGNAIGSPAQYCGAIYSNNWFRSSGVSGWYNETYGGGIYMDNANEVKVYNGKAFYVPSSITSGNQITCASNLNVGGTIVLYAPGISYYGSSVGGGSANQIGFRWTNPYVNCTVDNVISAAAANFSDRRLKTNIKTLTNGIELVRQLRCITYNPLDVIGFEEETLEPIIGDLDPYDEMIGFVADEVQEVYANAIHGEGNRMKSIDTVQLLSMAVSAIQDLDVRLQQLETV